MKKYRLRVGLDVDDILYDCNAYALERLNEKRVGEPPLTIYDIRGWGRGESAVDARLAYFSSPEFVQSQPVLPGAKEFVRRLADVAEVFFVTAVPPACMSARALRLAEDFPYIPQDNILIGTRKDMVNLDILLDDGAHNITRTPATYPVLFRRPWNSHLSGLLSVNSYEDFLHLVDMICHSFANEAPNVQNGGVVCLVGPTGTGKNAVAAELVKMGMEKPVTATTRPRRSGEGDDSYRFLSEQDFIAEREAGGFLETTVYSGHYFGTSAAAIDSVVNSGKCAVIPIDICGALTLKNRYRSRAILVFLHRGRYDVIRDIVSRELGAEDMTRRILSLDDEYRNEELCDVTVQAGGDPTAVAASIAAACKNA